MAVVALWFDPATGAAEGVAPSDASPDPAGRWRVIVENDAVSILGDTGKRKVGLIGSGRWSGSGIARRYAVDAPISDSTWGKLEHALRRAFAGGAPRAAAAAVAEAAVAEAAATERAAAAERVAPMPADAASGAASVRGFGARQTGSKARERRSGWWAFAAFGVALVGTLVSWQMMPPGDSVALGITIALGVGAFALAIYGGYGLGTLAREFVAKCMGSRRADARPGRSVAVVRPLRARHGVRNLDRPGSASSRRFPAAT